MLTWAAEQYDTAPVAAVAGACCTLVAVAGLCTPVRGARHG
ncbi:hypothetical protein ACFV23_36975 [Streptomyces sp. NPDC059627]